MGDFVVRMDYAFLVFGGLFLGAFLIFNYGSYLYVRVRNMVNSILDRIKSGDQEMEEVLNSAGYAYDAEQDIFYSTLDAWQRDYGYCRLYDEAAAPLNMIIDCEPIYFNYAGKRWLIELWKGQYAMSMGCEVGIYNTTRPDFVIPGIFKGPFFDCVGDEEMLHISYTAKKNGKVIFAREDRQWWLTGFVLGEFAEPSEITMDVSITLKDEIMREAFVAGLIEAGYHQNEIMKDQNTVKLTFDKTRTRQPFTRTPVTDWLIQRKNEILCRKFRKIIGASARTSGKTRLLNTLSPEIIVNLRNFGKHKGLFEVRDAIIKYLG